MDDGNAELSDKLSDNVLSSNPESSSHFQGSTSMNIATNDLSRSTTTCTHTHTCNPPGPDAAHKHTCYHTHTEVFASDDDDDREHTNSKPERPSGNREAVRKYREKKKARTVFLEEEVEKLHLANQQLVRKLQGQAILEAELSRLRSILASLKGKIDNELGVFPFQKQYSSSSSSTILEERTGSLHCQNNLPCFQPHASSSQVNNICDCPYGKSMLPWEGNCQTEIVDCQVDASNMTSTEGQTVDNNFMSSTYVKMCN